MTSQQAILKRIVPYVPPYWLRQAWMDPTRSLVRREARFRAAVLFVDISGFTPMTEALSQGGPKGVEELSGLLDRYFAAMSEPVVALGGEVFKFAGDSMIVLFGSDEQDLYLGAAIECAMRMQRATRRGIRTRGLAEPLSLEIKIGISEGPVYTTTVGDEIKGMQPVLAGRALVRAMQAENVAQPGEVLVDAMLTSRLPGRLAVGEARETFRVIVDAQSVPLPEAARAVDVSECEEAQAGSLVRRLEPYLAPQVVERIRQGDRAVSCEHRSVTTMFVRFGGPAFDLGLDGAALKGEDAPSRAGRALQKYVVAMRDCIQRHGGRLNEVDFTILGGTLVVFFGAPIAQENDELAAVSCAWEMQRVLSRLVEEWSGEDGRSKTFDLYQSACISSGSVFVGDVGAEVRRTYALVGDAVNLASRMTALAQPGEILVTDAVRRATEAHFFFGELRERDIRGKVDRVRLALVAEPKQESQADAARSRLLRHPHPVGRAPELAVLDGVRERAWQGTPQLLQMVGQAGMGKSCLAGQLARRWLARGGRVFARDDRRVGSEGSQSQPYGLWLDLLDSVLGALDTKSWEEERQRIRRELAAAGLVSGAGPACEPTPPNALDAPDVASQSPCLPLHLAVLRLLAAVSEARPSLLVVEDVDRSDDASRVLLRDLVAELGGTPARHVPVLVCVTGRPTGEESLLTVARESGLPVSIEATQIVVGPLSEADSFDLAERLLQAAGLGSDLAPRVVERARGNPLFIQAMVQEWAAAGKPAVEPERPGNQEGKRPQPHEPARDTCVPERVANAVLAQLDPLSEDLKLSLRLAAVIGHAFPFHILRAAHPAPPSRSELAGRLADLERRHLVQLAHVGASRPEGEPPEASRTGSRRRDRALPNVYYCFRHPMTRQVIYDSLVSADRRRFHRAVARAMERIYAAKLDTQCERLAEHFSQGGVPLKGVVYSILAGRSAVKMRAVREALTYYDQADRMLSALQNPARCIQGVRLTLCLERGRVLVHLMDIERAKADLERAVFLAGDLADLGLQAKALLAWAEILMHEADYWRAADVVRRAMQCLVALGDRRRQGRAWKLQSRIHAAWGQPEAALQCAERTESAAFARYLGTVYLSPSGPRAEPDVAPIHRRQTTTDWSLTIEEPVWLALAAAHYGEWGRALRLARDGIAAGWALGTPLDVADAKWATALVLSRMGAYQEASGYLDEAMAAYEEAGWRRGQLAGLVLRGHVQMSLGLRSQAVACWRRALACAQETHTVPAIVRAQVGLGVAAALDKQFCRAERFCVEARARARQARLCAALVEAQVGLARVYLEDERWELARVQAAQSLETSRALGYRDATLWSAEALAQAWKGLGDRRRAQAYADEADAVARQLVEALPPAYADRFAERRAELGGI